MTTMILIVKICSLLTNIHHFMTKPKTTSYKKAHLLFQAKAPPKTKPKAAYHKDCKTNMLSSRTTPIKPLLPARLAPCSTGICLLHVQGNRPLGDNFSSGWRLAHLIVPVYECFVFWLQGGFWESFQVAAMWLFELLG